MARQSKSGQCENGEFDMKNPIEFQRKQSTLADIDDPTTSRFVVHYNRTSLLQLQLTLSLTKVASQFRAYRKPSSD